MPNMAIFKKRCAPGANATTQCQKQKDQHEAIPTHEAATSAPPTQQVTKAAFGTLRYSDMVAERRCTINVTPIKKLVDTFELFEQVLDYLPMKEVLLTTRVCRAFKTNIGNSSLLQAKLFLAPDLTMKKMAVSSSGTLLSGVKAEEHIAAIELSASNPPLSFDIGDYERYVLNIVYPAREPERLADRCRDGSEIELYILHPSLRAGRLSDRYRHQGIVQYAETYVQTSLSYSHQDLTFCDLPTVAALLPTSSFGRMFVSQPPVKEVRVCFPFLIEPPLSSKWLPGPRIPPRQGFAFDTIRKKAGVTFGDLVAVVRCATKSEIVDWSRVYMSTAGGFEVNARARSVIEMAGELSREDDPTRWVDSESGKVLKEGGFAFA
jgi:hypothetical protein